MGLVHGVPGTTFSNVGQRGSYDSDKAACLTLEEVERWLTIAVAKYYHQHPHEGLDGQTPLRRWQEGVALLLAAGDSIPVPRDPRAYLVDFLPVLRRTLQRDGITIDHLTYFSSALRAWITARDRPGPVLVRRDPRDLSRVFVLDPQDDGYLEVPTRDLSRPAISLWEHRLARRRLRARHRGEVDEAALFAAIEEMRAAERDAARLTRSARRDRARRSASPEQPASPPPATSAAPASAQTVVADVMLSLDGLQGQGVISLGEFERDAGDGRGSAMLDGERDAIVGVAAQIEVGIAPGVEFGRSAQGLTGADGAGALPGMVDDGDGDGMAPLQFTQEGEQWGDVAADILVDAMQADEWIEDQQPRPEGGDGLLEPRAVGLEIEAQTGCGDQVSRPVRRAGLPATLR